jgi:hypothetical protein
LLYQHFHVGLHIPHSTLHFVDSSGIVIAVAATLSAAVGEILSLRRTKVGSMAPGLLTFYGPDS